LVITSYALLRLDVEAHRALQYAAVILDEAQQIKNPDSQNAQAAVALRAKHRFVMTGTPVENSVRDLWSLMHFLMPGYLGTRKEFKERYEGPIGTQPGGPEQQRLVKRIRPFLLRRTKVNVAKELPHKLEQVAWCELSGRQREIYAELAKAARQRLSELAGAKDQKQGRMVMLTALLRLRQAACDVRLLGADEEIPEEEASAKLELLMELLTEAQEGGHRVLVFSQFVKMLTGIRSRLESEGVSYCYLDGSSKDRAAPCLCSSSASKPAAPD
jgi:SNF2 family DNA or RNA helicase